MGTAQRTERNAANQLSADLIMQYARWKEAIPDFAFRGHVHRVSDSSINFPIRSVIGGCWQMATPFVHRIGGGATKPEIGVIYCDVAKKNWSILNMITKENHLNISKSKAQKILDEAIEQSVKEKVLVDLLPTDWTVERLREKGLSERQARDTLAEMVKRIGL